ncbi:four helix bundle protein [Epilithonimonas vandammei]|uniref:Four helix bundle protein n=2 Tax=Epilithonimonas TaxID=2782229 RepID=A0A3G8ZH43_9FLAO|nr:MULTISPECIES: four helix bundle protein [Epilithonimonas]AZI56583.1 four helix bundle protein [Epilithonimonas vandammei]REC72491.1 four helix bundle protein [Epilithonimonas hispanica]
MYQFYFEKLEVWQNSRRLVKDIYIVTTAFPENEKFGITNQLRRASTSISANIAEGFSRQSNKEKSRFLNIAFGSTIEVINFLILSNDLGFLNDENYRQLREKSEFITNQINSLNKSINK